jgi:N6-L-threonylcarbamoyladenine synthase
MKILAIETSCDETAVALVEASGDLNKPKFEVLKKAVHSQIEDHKEYGGVYPSLAKREHAKNLVPVLSSVIPAKAGISPKQREIPDQVRDDIKSILEREPGLYESAVKMLEEYDKPDVDMIAVTSGPGLEPALWVGVNFAKVLSLVWQIPLMPVNHMEGHMTSVLLKQNRSQESGIRNKKLEFPALALLISGGHTELVSIKNWNEYKILGKTRDDAVGESYDKVARLLGYPYPGGPKISQLAEKFRNKESGTRNQSGIKFPRPMIDSGDLDFSFSGLKTAVLYKIQNLTTDDSRLTTDEKENVAGEFEQAVVDVLLNKVGSALNTEDFKTIITAGGVVANPYVRENIANLAQNYGISALFPEFEDSTDNAQMIAVAAYLKSFISSPRINPEIVANGGLTY